MVARDLAVEVRQTWEHRWIQNPQDAQLLQTATRRFQFGLWFIDVVTRVQSKRISQYRTQNRFEALVPQEVRNVKPRVQEAFDLTIADSDTDSIAEVESPRPQNHARVSREGGEVSVQESESEEEGCPSEQEIVEDNQSEQAEEEQVECGEPVQDILFLPERRSMATGFESLDVEKVFEVRALVMKSVPGF